MSEVHKFTREEYASWDPEKRSIVRCFAAIEQLPMEALEDMRHMAIIGASMARQILDTKEPLPSSLVSVARRFIETHDTVSTVRR